MEPKYYFIKPFPKPLSKKEENELFQKLKDGYDYDAREKLIIHNLKLVGLAIELYFNSSYAEDNDILNVGIIGLINSVDKFNLDKNISFSTYALKSIRNEIIKYINNKQKYDFDTVSLNEPIDDDSDITFENIIKNENINIEETYNLKEKNQIIRNCLSCLTNQEKTIVMLHYGFINDKNYTLSEIGNILNLTHQRIHQILKKSLLKIKDEIEKDNDIKNLIK